MTRSPPNSDAETPLLTITRSRFVIGCILLLGISITYAELTRHKGSKENFEENSISVTKAQTSKRLSDCVASLSSQHGGWCELRVGEKKPGISNVWPDKRPRIRQDLGPSAVIIAWGSTAYDTADQILYFMGGGGREYGGNEVYSFSLKAGEWTRLSDPSSLDYFTGTQRKYWIPDTRYVPAAPRVYDGLIFNKVTRTMILLAHNIADGAKIRSKDKQPSEDRFLPQGAEPQQYEFNPSTTESRNGLPPLTWRKIGNHPWTSPRTTQLDDGTLLLGSKTKLFKTVIDDTGKIDVRGVFSEQKNYRSGNTVYDAHRNIVWSIHKERLFGFDLQGKLIRTIISPVNTGKSLAFDSNGRAVIWDGRGKIYWLDPDKDTAIWHVIDWGENGPKNGRVGKIYGKWLHVEKNIFAGISSHRQGIWIYVSPNDGDASRPISSVNIQAIVDRAPDGSTLKLPPGLYAGGLKVSSPLTIDMTGVELLGVSGGKGILVIEQANGPVTVKNFKADGSKAYATTGNLAGIRISGIDFNVTLENVEIQNTALGVMTDNRGGNLTISNSFIHDIGTYKKEGLSHIVYAGAIDKLEVKNSILQRSMHLGHILKSRAKITSVTSSKLLGLDSRHSRVIDLSCGGRLRVSDSILQSSSNSDNADLISVGVEKRKNCKRGLLAGDVELTNNTIIFDRGAAPIDSVQRGSANRMFTWKTPLTSLKLYGNTIVSSAGNSLLDQQVSNTPLSSMGNDNNVYRNRVEANLNREINSEP